MLMLRYHCIINYNFSSYDNFGHYNKNFVCLFVCFCPMFVCYLVLMLDDFHFTMVLVIVKKNYEFFDNC